MIVTSAIRDDGPEKPHANSDSHDGDSESPNPFQSIIDAIRKDTTIWITATLFVIVIGRVLVVTRGDIPTALAVISTAGVATVIVNTVLSTLGGIALLIAYGILVISIAPLHTPKWSMARSTLFMATILIGFLLAPIDTLPGTFGIFLLLAVLGFLNQRSLKRPSTRRIRTPPAGLTIFTLGLVLGYLLIWQALWLAPVWLPAESVHTKTGKIIGYVLSDSGDWVSVLTEEDRLVVRMKANTIESRTICQVALPPGAPRQPTLPQELSKKHWKEPPRCSDV